jgi:uncharacterized protein (TIGR03546 family)
MLRTVAKLLKVMNSETDPAQISLAVCLSMVAGLTPFLSLHNIVVLIIVFLFHVNLSAFFLGLALFSGAAYLLDPFFHRIGLAVLTEGALEGLWTAMYNSTLWRIEKFNNTIIMGSLVFSLALFIPLFIFSNLLIRKYREHVIQWVRKTKIMQFFRASKFYDIYQSVSGWGDRI